MRKKKLDVLVLAALSFLAAVYAYSTNGLFIGRTLFVFAAFTIPPTVYLSYREKKNWKKI